MGILIREVCTHEDCPIIRERESRLTRFLLRLEESVCRSCCLLDRHPNRVLVGLSLLYFGVSGALAYWKLMWFDELCTYFVTARPNAAAIWSMLAAGSGPMPPSFYLLTRFSQHWLGPTHIAIRFPELVGFLVASLCLFHFIRRRTNALCGLIGMLAVWITGAYPFAYEARPYGLVLGFCGIALVCWQFATEQAQRTWALVGLFAALGGAVASHYGAVMLVFPLALGEMVRSISRRKVDWPVWLAFCGAGLPLLVFFPLLHASLSPYGLAMWSRPRLGSIYDCYTELLAIAWHPFAAILCALVVWRGLRWRAALRTRVIHLSSMPLWEIAAAIGLLLLPIIGLLQAVLLTNQITARYVMPLVMGFGILFAFLVHKNLRHDAVGGVLIFALLLTGWISHVRWEYLKIKPEQGQLQALYQAAIRQPGNLPILINDGNRFFELLHYAPSEFSSRVFYLIDPETARKYSGTDSVDLCVLRYGRFLPFNLPTADSFLRAGRPFLLYGPSTGWLLPVLRNDGAKIESIGVPGGHLYRIEPNGTTTWLAQARSNLKITD